MLEVVSDVPSLLKLREPWNALADRFDNPFLRHECAVACAEAFCGPKELAVFLIRSSDGEIRAIAPFRATRRAGVTRLESLCRVIHEPTGLLFADDDALDRAVGAALSGRLPLMLGRLAVDGPEMRRLRGASDILRITERADSSVWVPLSAGWQALEGGMSSSRRGYVRRKQRQAERHGAVEFEALAPDPASLEPLLREAFRVEAAGWKGRNGTAIILKPSSHKFFTQYCRAAAQLGMLRLFFLRINGRTAAMRIALQYANRLWEVKIGYDEQFHECSPGVLLTHETLRHCCAQGLAAFEFLGLAEPWEFAWTEQTHTYASPTLYPVSVGGCFALMQEVGWDLTKKSLKALNLDAESRKMKSRRASAAAAAAALRRSGGPIEEPTA